MNQKLLLEKVDQYIRTEIETYGVPAIEVYELPYPIADHLATKLKADPLIVKLGIRLMDCKLSEAMNMNRLQEHVKMSVQATEELLKQNNCPQKIIKQVITCIKEHHNTKWSSKEAEICANANCYKFLTQKGVFLYMHSLGKRSMRYDLALELLKTKIEEKWKILSLPTCKKEVSPQYKKIMNLIKNAKLT